MPANGLPPEPSAAGAAGLGMPQPPFDGVTVLHMGDDFLVLDKPAGLMAVPGRGPDKQDCLSLRALAHWPDARVVHRLDMATSGLVVMARGAQAQRVLSEAFAQRQVHKRYEALVHGVPSPAEPPDGTGWHCIDLPIAADWPRRPLRVIDAQHGQPSTTRWRTLQAHLHAAGGATARLALEPVTGRTHQLRVHLQALGHPILGDALYGNAAVQARAPRLLLHACGLGFADPATGVWRQFESAVPF